MRTYSLSHLDDTSLLRQLNVLVARDRAITAALLAHIAEVDARRLYAPAGYSSMHAYCVGELRLSDDAAYKRITAARAARQFPALLNLVAEGRLHLTAIRFIAPHLTRENADELMNAAAGLGRSELEGMLARRFSHPDELDFSPALATPPDIAQMGAAQTIAPELSIEPQLVPGRVEAPDRAPVHPLQTQRVVLKVAIDRTTQDKLHYAQSLLSHSNPTGDLGQVLDRALDALIGQLERRKFAKTSRPRARQKPGGLSPSPSPSRARSVPAPVRRAVWQRDEGRCTFVGVSGHRCGSRRFLEFDHVDPVARGGQPTVDRMRLRCRTHNQLEAERAFGAAFMNAQRARARRSGAADSGDVLAGLVGLGIAEREALRAIEESGVSPQAPLEERLRAALGSLRPGRVRPTAGAEPSQTPARP